MKVYRLLPAATLAVFAGCSGDSVSHVVTPAPHAAIRWVNAVPDTMAMDYRIVDDVTNANEASVAYRGTSGAYRPVSPGTHRIRVFPSGTVTAMCNGPDVVSKVLLDTTVTFATNHYYTIVHAGYMNASATPKHRLVVLDDVFPTVASGNIAIRAVNALATVGTADFFVVPATATGGAVSGATFSGVAFGAASQYTSVAAAATTPATSSYRVAAAAAGSTTVLADALLPIGTPAYAGNASVPPLDPVGGTQQAGSILTAIATPPGVSYKLTSSGSDPACPAAGTVTTVAATSSGAMISLVDKNPKDKLLGQ